MSEILTAVIVDALTGETVEREFTAEEVSERESMQTEVEATQAEATAKAKARASALAKLKKLGLTAAEIEAL